MGACNTSTERVAVLEQESKRLREDFAAFVVKNSTYTESVHKKLNDTNGMINLLRADYFKSIHALDRRMDSHENSIHNTDKLLEEFKTFGEDITKAINEIKIFIATKVTKESTIAWVFKLTAQLAGFAATVIAIIKYLG